MKANLNFNRRQWLAATFGFLATSIASPILAQTRIRRIRTQYIAALGAEGATFRNRRGELGDFGKKILVQLAYGKGSSRHSKRRVIWPLLAERIDILDD